MGRARWGVCRTITGGREAKPVSRVTSPRDRPSQLYPSLTPRDYAALHLSSDTSFQLKGRILWTKDPILGFLFVEVDTELGKDVCRPKDEK